MVLPNDAARRLCRGYGTGVGSQMMRDARAKLG